MKKILIAAIALLTVSTAVYADMTVKEKWNELNGRRFDFLDASGNRVFSSYYNYSGPVLFQVQENGNLENGFNVKNGFSQDFKSIKVVPWGENSYPLEVTSPNDDVNYTVTRYELEDTNGDGVLDYNDIDFTKITLPKKKRSAAIQENVKCGTGLLYSFDIPEGTYPVFMVNSEYSNISYDGEPFYNEFRLPIVNELYNDQTYFHQNWLFNAENRNWQLNNVKGNGSLCPDPVVKNRWHVYYSMQNEPQNIKITYERLDDSVVSNMINRAATCIYRYQQGLENIQAPFFNGEPWTMTKCGEAFSQDCIANMAASANPMFVSHEFYSTGNYWLPQVPWIYYYGMIEMANSRLYLLDNLQFSSDRVNEARAVMRALRGNAYLRILQLYAPRWEDSNDGRTLVAPLCTEWGNLDIPASSMAEIRDFAKADLEYAISQLEGNSYSFSNVPNADVARGLLIRLSMLCHDWQTVNQQSQILLDKYPLTSNDEMQAGFFSPAKSWIWTATESMPTYYFSYASSVAINGTYTIHWGSGSAIGSIDRELFLQIPKADIRRNLFAMPENMATPGTRFFKMFFDSGSVNESTLALSGSPKDFTLNLISKSQPAGIYGDAIDFYKERNANVYFGSQFKFWGGTTMMYNENDRVCLMRTEEILLSRAEALVELGDNMGALQLLNQLNSMRNPEYQMSMSTGTALRDEIRLARRIELWGEGHSFFDFKRWNLPINRKPWEAGNQESGNWPLKSAFNILPNNFNGWRYVIPQSEVKANPQLDIKSLGYKYLTGYGDSIDTKGEEPDPGRVISPELLAPTPKFKGIIKGSKRSHVDLTKLLPR